MNKISSFSYKFIFSLFCISFLNTNLFAENSTNHLKKIIFGAGCFWSVEKKFQESYGVVNVESGYADGKNIKPVYKEIIKRGNKFNPNNFAEVVRVTYNSNQTDLENLVKIFSRVYLFIINHIWLIKHGIVYN